MPRRSKFTAAWMDPQKFPRFASWVTSGPDEYTARCSLCLTHFAVDNMGVRALESHSKSAKHARYCESARSSVDIRSAFKKNQSSCNFRSVDLDENNVIVTIPKQGAADDSLRVSQDPDTMNQHSEGKISSGTFEKKNPVLPTKHFKFDQQLMNSVTNAEILWCMRLVKQHYSFNSCVNLSDDLQEMFPDSIIASNFSLGRDKAAYTITHGLAPYFRLELLDRMRKPTPTFFCSFFDEAYNEVTKKNQCDVHITFFDETTNSVTYRYLGSSFLDHSDTTSIAQGLIDVHGALSISQNCVQLSMDGPNVNWCVQKAMEDKKMKENPTSPKLLQMGSCSLHVLHGAYKSAQMATDWELKTFMKSAHKLFEKSPARRSDFIFVNETYNESGSTDNTQIEFPKPFCGHRWLENGPVLTRLIGMLTNLQKYVNYINRQPKSKRISTQSFHVIETALQGDESLNLSYAKLEFSNFICRLIEPFLTKFQGQRPMAPFLYEDVSEILSTIMNCFLKCSIVETARADGNLLSIDLAYEGNLKSIDNIDIGFGAKSRCKKLKPSQILNFRNNCMKFFTAFCKKLTERCCLNFPLTQAVSSISPKVISKSITTSQARMTSLLGQLHENLYISSETADVVKRQFDKLLETPDFKFRCQAFVFSDRLDEFYSEMLVGRADYTELWVVIKIVLILSHGNARVEAGFSINSDSLVTNLKEETLQALRFVYDALESFGGPSMALITPTMVKFVRQARQR